MTFTAQLLLFQSVLSLPPLGFVKTPLGLSPLYGMRSNFLLGEPIPAVQSAARFRAVEAWKLPGEIRIFDGRERRIPAAEGIAFFSMDSETEVLYAWLPESSELIRWTEGEVYRVFVAPVPAETIAFAFAKPDRVQIFSRATEGITVTTFSATSLQFIETSAIPEASHIAVDTKGNRWLATQSGLTCGTRQWVPDSTVAGLDPLDQGWILVTTNGGQWAARCDSEELAAIPQSGSSQ